MALSNDEQNDQLSHNELIVLVKELISLAGRQEAHSAALEAELEKPRRPPATSWILSNPPSREQIGNKLAKGLKKKHRPPFGHQQHTQLLIDHPDLTIPSKVEQRADCRADLRRVKPRLVLRLQVTELPPVKLVVFETHRYETFCPHRQTIIQGALPEGLEAERSFGARLEALVVHSLSGYGNVQSKITRRSV